jgi:putative FmdB family regulatory protein
LYAYRCTQCGHRFEKIQSFNAEPEKVCPQCGSPVERLLTVPGLQFKGAGWYVNDYSSKSSASSDSAPSETKPETKPEAKPAGSGDSGSASSAPSTPAPSSGSTNS